MDKQKQIEELMKDMCADYPCNSVCDQYCGMYDYAERAINAGYRKIPENAVVLTEKEYEELKKGIKTYNYTAMFDAQNAYRWEQGYFQGVKETAEKFAPLRKYITEQFHRYHEIRDKSEADYKKSKDENGKMVLNNDWHRADAIMFILEKVGIEFDEIAKEFTEGNGND